MKRTTRAVALVVLAGSLVAAMVVPAFAGKGPSWRPDGLIRGGVASDYLGDDIYNETAAGQTMFRKLKPGYTDRYRFMYQNDGFNPDLYGVHADPSAGGFKVEYFKNGENITVAITNEGFYPDMIFSGESSTISMRVTAKKNAKPGSSHRFFIELFSKSGYDDVVAVDITVKKGAGDANSES